uniref:Sushi domain-containing protein n=2 Tax=Ciona intestinalis TaxID=7719 RepID=H2XPA4_CIOIN
IIALILVVVGCKGVIISLPAYGDTATRALGISNLKISTTISTTGVSSCGWRYGGEFDVGGFYSGTFVRCYNYTGVNETITCVNNAGTVTSQLTLLQPQYKDLNINMQCSPSPSYSVNIVFKACPTSIISPGVILSKQSTSPCGYGCTARFSCAAGYTGNTVDATCNEQATW